MQKELPKYNCKKQVWALKIGSINYQVDNQHSAMITPEKTRYSPFMVSFDYISTHMPEPGGYYIVHVDGRESFSPSQYFETEHSIITTGVNKNEHQ